MPKKTVEELYRCILEKQRYARNETFCKGTNCIECGWNEAVCLQRTNEIKKMSNKELAKLMLGMEVPSEMEDD